MTMTDEQPVSAPFRCPLCEAVLAYTDGRVLHINTTVVRQKIHLHCGTPGCGGGRTWRPAPSGQ